MEINIDPYFFSSSTDVKNISHGFLKKFGLSYFQYCSVFADDTSFFLVTHPDFTKERVHKRKRILSHVDSLQLDHQTYIFLWNESLPIEDTDMARQHGIDHGLCFVERFKDHYNLIAFGAPVGTHMGNFYLNNLNRLWGFVKEFKDRASDLLQIAHQKKFLVPEFHNDVNRQKLFLKKSKKISLNHEGVSIALSEMEFKCLSFLASGFTMKAMSHKLSVSPRTIETYVDRLKSKTGIFTKQDLVSFFHENAKGQHPFLNF